MLRERQARKDMEISMKSFAPGQLSPSPLRLPRAICLCGAAHAEMTLLADPVSYGLAKHVAVEAEMIPLATDA
ncbi:hypothetical protein MRB53_041211 [Persea americana]|nr:hypothetical protein MRB53_041211 [Persea americana]